MDYWNVVVMVQWGWDRAVFRELRHMGEFRHTPFQGVFTGRVDDTAWFLDQIHQASEAGVRWTQGVARVIPVEHTFEFTPEGFEERLREAITPCVERMSEGTFYVRLERRGYKGKIISPEVERAMDAHIIVLGERQGKHFRVSFEDPDYIIAVETVTNICGVALFDREIRKRYPLIKIR